MAWVWLSVSRCELVKVTAAATVRWFSLMLRRALLILLFSVKIVTFGDTVAKSVRELMLQLAGETTNSGKETRSPREVLAICKGACELLLLI